MQHLRTFPFWIGLLLIIFGITILLNAILGIHIPIGRICLGMLLCYLGYVCLTGRRRHYKNSSCCHFCHTTATSTTLDTVTLELNEETLKDKDPFEYTTTLGNTTIDLTNVYSREDMPRTKHTFVIDTVLGKTVLKINKSYSFCIHIHSTGAQVELPHGQKLHAKNHLFCSPEGCTNPDLEIHAHTTLGNLEIILV